MTDISGINSKLIGISFLSEGENMIIKSIWSKAFSSRDALWVEASISDMSQSLADRVCEGIRKQALDILNRNCAVALFFDSNSMNCDGFLTEIRGISEKLQSILFCTVQLELEFVLIGTNPVPSEKAKNLKESILLLSKQNVEYNQNMKRVCLVARNRIMSETDARPWIPVILFLDLLRRTGVNHVLPAEGSDGNDDVCFIRFAEYDRPGYMALEAHISSLGKQLGSAGFPTMRTNLSDQLKAIEEEVRSAIQVDENKVPVHSGMTVTGAWKRRKARRGKNDEFFIAQRNTKAALLEAGKELTEEINTFFLNELPEDKCAYFWKLAEDANAGLDLIADSTKMRELFADESGDIAQPSLPALNYNEDGYREEIKAYLVQMREYAIKTGKNGVYEALGQAYEAIPEEEFAEKRRTIQLELAEESNELANMPDEITFIQSVTGDGSYLRKEFFPVLPGGMTRRLVVDANPEDARKHDSIVGQKATVLLLPGAQIQYLDAAKPKGLHMLSFNCDQKRLDDLIKEE